MGSLPDWLVNLYIIIVFTGTIGGAVWGGYEVKKDEGSEDQVINALLIAGIIGFFVSLIVGWIVCQGLNLLIYSIAIPAALGIWWFMTTYWLAIIGVTTVGAGVVYGIRNSERVREWTNNAIEILAYWIDRVAEWVKNNDRAIARYASRQTKRLMNIAPEFEWLDIRTSINEIGMCHIPNLLRERKSLLVAIKRVQGVLNKVAWQREDRTDFEEANARRSAQTAEQLVVQFQRNARDIAEAVDALRHLEADLAAATVDAYRRDEINAKLRGLVSRIQANSVAVQEARDEAGMHQQPRRLTE